MSYTFQKGNVVAFIPRTKHGGFRGRYTQCKVLDIYNDHEPMAARILKGKEEIIVRQDELEPLVAYAARMAALKRDEAVRKSEPIAKAWSEGARTVKQVAEKLGLPSNKIVSKFRMAMRWGLLKETNDTNQNQEAVT